MGWSESYYEDMRKEAERELHRLSLILREPLGDFREAVAHYREFTEYADELEILLHARSAFTGIKPGLDELEKAVAQCAAIPRLLAY